MPPNYAFVVTGFVVVLVVIYSGVHTYVCEITLFHPQFWQFAFTVYSDCQLFLQNVCLSVCRDVATCVHMSICTSVYILNCAWLVKRYWTFVQIVCSTHLFSCLVLVLRIPIIRLTPVLSPGGNNIYIHTYV